jgi:hypothetical protein
MGKAEVKVLASVVLADDPELAAIKWLVKFINAASVAYQPDLFSWKSGSGFAEFQVIGLKAQNSLFPPLPKELKQLEPFHAEFRQAIRVALESRGRLSVHRILLDASPTNWMLFYRQGEGKSPSFFSCGFAGNWKLSFLSRVTFLLGRFGDRLKLCPTCSKVFLAEHGNQAYDTRECSDRKRYERFRSKHAATV